MTVADQTHVTGFDQFCDFVESFGFSGDYCEAEAFEFGVFDEFERKGESADFARFANESLSEMQWGDQEYLCGHVQDIAMRIHRELYTL